MFFGQLKLSAPDKVEYIFYVVYDLAYLFLGVKRFQSVAIPVYWVEMGLQQRERINDQVI